MYLIFDTETTGRPDNYNAPISDSNNWPRMVQLAWQLHDEVGKLISVKNYIIKPEGYEIPYEVIKIHGITQERAEKTGIPLVNALEEFNHDLALCKMVAGHNVDFDIKIIGAEFYRKNIESVIAKLPSVDTMASSTDFCALPGGRGGNFKFPKLEELHRKLFKQGIDTAHNAAADVEATARCFFELIRLQVIPYTKILKTVEQFQSFVQFNPKPFEAIGLNTQPYNPNDFSETSIADTTPKSDIRQNTEAIPLETLNFTHLHVHSQYSILDGMIKIKDLAEKAKSMGMKAVALTDHGNMFGIKEFHEKMTAAGLKPILGMDAYVAMRTHLDKEKQDARNFSVVLLAKNEIGYKNLMRLSSIAYADGFYYKPRIDKGLMAIYSEGIICCSGGLEGEISSRLRQQGVVEAEKAVLEYKTIFGDDFYLQIQRHPASDSQWNTEIYQDEQFVNRSLIEFANNHQIKLVAANDVHFLNESDAPAHDRLVCMDTGQDLDDPRRRKYSGQEWLKTADEMTRLFSDIPQAIANTMEIADKVDFFELNKSPIMPDFQIPDGFENQDEYLRHLTYEGAHWRWGEVLSQETIDRIDFELETVKKMGFPGYFLIVWDFLKAAREMKVWVGPGRGSAAGSVVAYCLRITEIDPLKYNLLFERFLNPDRISMPDMDIDFDDVGREKVLEYVRNKYGKRRVAHLVTFGTMAAKSAIRDVARVQKLHLSEADVLAKLVPDKPGTTLQKAFAEVPELKNELENGTKDRRSVLDYAQRLEGSVKNLGTHACGIIISKEDLDEYVPITTVKESVLNYATQYDGHFIESVGLLKMDFLGLSTLTILKDAIENIKISKNIDLDISSISLEDKATYELYARGETSALFQFESDGMKKHLRNLKPTRFEDLIAMNALYRPGPMDYIDSFIKRKHGREKVVYPIEEMSEILDETNGITVYQEQVMLLSRKLAGFSRGQSDSLRKAMGKKKKEEMDKLKAAFMEGCVANGHKEEIIEKIWKDWEAFANYAFNKSHATCYSYVSYQTAFLKAHYPAEFMASVLSHELGDIKKLNLYLSECNKMNLKVLGPDVNESYSNFTVNVQGEIRYGMAGIKGVGEAAVQSIIDERKLNGPFIDIFDFVKRVNLRSVNKKAMESLAMSGAFDGIQPNNHRAQFFQLITENETFIERLLKHGNRLQSSAASAQFSLFGESGADMIQNPDFPECQPWNKIKQLNFEKEMIGFFLSGHPLETHKAALKFFVGNNITELVDAVEHNKRINFRCAGIVTKVMERETANGSKFGIYTVEDQSDSIEIALFKENYLKNSHLFVLDNMIYFQGNIRESYRDKTKGEVNLNDVSLLENVVTNQTKLIKVQMPLGDINANFVDEMYKTIKANSGSVPITFFIKHENQQLELFTKKLRVAPEPFVQYLDNKNITFKLS